MSMRKSSYTRLPTVPQELLPRLAAIVEALAGLKSVSEAARSIGLSRNHFQTILHRAVLALAESITLKKGGRPAQPRRIATLQAQLKKLQRENARLQRGVESTERLLEVAGGLLKGRIRPTRRQRRIPRSTAASGEHSDDSDPATRCRDVLEAVAEMRALGLTQPLAAAIVGVDAATLRRWCARASAPKRRSRYAQRIEPTAAAQAEQLVRQLHGLIGAETLRHSVDELSHRVAASIKTRTLRLVEHERKSASIRVRVAQPGILRGLDAMQVATLDGTAVCADQC